MKNVSEHIFSFFTIFGFSLISIGGDSVLILLFIFKFSDIDFNAWLGWFQCNAKLRNVFPDKNISKYENKQ